MERAAAEEGRATAAESGASMAATTETIARETEKERGTEEATQARERRQGRASNQKTGRYHRQLIDAQVQQLFRPHCHAQTRSCFVMNRRLSMSAALIGRVSAAGDRNMQAQQQQQQHRQQQHRQQQLQTGSGAYGGNVTHLWMGMPRARSAEMA